MPILIFKSTFYGKLIIRLNFYESVATPILKFYFGFLPDKLYCTDHVQSCFDTAVCMIGTSFWKSWHTVVAIAQQLDSQTVILLYWLKWIVRNISRRIKVETESNYFSKSVEFSEEIIQYSNELLCATLACQFYWIKCVTLFWLDRKRH